MNLSLCGCGFLGIYHLGVAVCLRDHAPSLLGSLKRVCGASAGSLIGCVLVADPSKIEACIDFTLKLADDIRKKPLGAMTPGFNLLVPLRGFLEEHLPPNAHQLCSDTLYVSVTNVQTKKNEVANQFSSNEDLIQHLMASCHIPLYAALRSPVISGKKYMDGGMTNNLVVFEDGRTLTVSPFCGPQDICPRDKPGKGWYFNFAEQHFQMNRRNMVRGIHALFPPSQKNLKIYLNQGMKDAERFLRKEGLYVS
ncbi:patatin-like phospholipase domain-containing protein 4 [Argopecten irradians]|uniref:patatin-like phospholipase domain-containing protein 4 n=1 Tax=Argopecten irradians TaxID=31199 RepID=UPI00371E4BF2